MINGNHGTFRARMRKFHGFVWLGTFLGLVSEVYSLLYEEKGREEVSIDRVNGYRQDEYTVGKVGS